MTELTDFLSNGNTLISNTASKLLEYQNQLKNGDISKDEYTELYEDSLDMNQIADAATSESEQIMIKDAFDVMLILAKSFA